MEKNFWEFSRSTFAVLLVGSVLATGALRWLGDHKTFAALVIPQIHLHGHWENFFALFAATVGFAGLTFMASGTKGFANWSQNFVYAGYAYLPLAFFGLFNIYFRQFISQGNKIPWLFAKLLGLEGVINQPQITSRMVALHALPPALVIFGGFLSLYLLRKLHEKYVFQPLAYRLHQVIILATCLAFIIIL